MEVFEEALSQTFGEIAQHILIATVKPTVADPYEVVSEYRIYHSIFILLYTAK
jgi:hypothetical protein